MTHVLLVDRHPSLKFKEEQARIVMKLKNPLILGFSKLEKDCSNEIICSMNTGNNYFMWNQTHKITI